MKKVWSCAVVLVVACSYPTLAPLGSDGATPHDGMTDGTGSGSGSGSGFDAGSVAFYHLNDGSGGTATDASGMGNNAPLIGAQVSWSAGWAGGGLNTTGSNGHASAPASPTLDVTRATLEAWVDATALPNSKVVIGKGTDFQLGFDGSAHASAKFTLANGDTVSIASVTVVTMNAWFHLAATWDGTTAAIYVNGVLERTVKPTTGGSLATTSSPLDIGPSFAGYLDEVRVFGLARTPTQVLDDATLIAYYRFDETTGSVAHDSSGNARDLTITSPSWPTGIVGNALGCDGSSVFASIASDPGLSVSGPLTIEAWVNGGSQTFPSNGGNVVVEKLQGAGATAFVSYGILRCCSQASTALVLHQNANASGASAEAPIAGAILNSQWHQYVGTYNGVYLCTYQDGYLLGCNNDPYPLSTGAGPFVVCGGDAMSAPYTGLVDEIRVYARQLAAPEIRAQFINP